MLAASTEGIKIMKRILIATTAILGLAGAAAAQEAPAVSGNYSANVSQHYNEDGGTVQGFMATGMVDFSATASVDNRWDRQWNQESARDYQVYTGK
jgi:hypothetical protein